MEQEVKRMDYFSQGYLLLGDYRGFYQAIYLTSINQKISDWFKIILLGKELRLGGAYKSDSFGGLFVFKHPCCLSLLKLCFYHVTMILLILN